MAAMLAGDIFNCIFLNGNDWIQIQISLKCVRRSPIDYKPALNLFNIGSSNGLVLNMQQAITCANDDPVHWRIYAALGGDELIG